MTRTTGTWIRIPAALSLATGCVHHGYSPPALMLPLESAATLPPGEAAVQGELGGVSWIDGATASVGARGSLSEPIGAREVDVTGTSDAARFVGKPGRTWIYATAGLRVPWGSHDPGAVRGNFLLGLAATHVADSKDDQGLVQLGLGAEVVF